MKSTINKRQISICFSKESASGWPVESFLRSVGLTDFSKWRQPQNASVGDDSELCFFGMMSIPIPQCISKESQWLCRCSNENGFGLFWVNDSPLAAIVSNERTLEAVFADIPSDVIHLSCHIPSTREIPQNIGRLIQLKSIDFCDSTNLNNIDAISTLPCLKHLSFIRCKSLKNVNAISDLANLETLDLQVCTRLSDISSVASLGMLKNLAISYSFALEDIDGIKHCYNLNRLNVSGCDNIHSYSAIGYLNNLISLDLTKFSKTDLAFLFNIRNIEELILSGSHVLEDIDGLKSCNNLRHLRFNACDNIKNYSAIGQLNRLEQLDLSHSNVGDISFLRGLTSLEDLNLWSCDNINTIEPIADLMVLKKLDLRNRWKWLDDLSPLTGLSSLENLELGSFDSLSSIQPLSCLANLTHLNLGACPHISDLTPIAACTKLSLFRLQPSIVKYYNIKELTFLRNLLSLETLAISGVESIETLDDLSQLTLLHQLWIEDAKLLNDIKGVSGLFNLKVFKLSGCESLTDISPIRNLRQLEDLELESSKVVDLSPLEDCECLARLFVGCAARSVAPIAQLSNLRILNLQCEAISEISALKSLKKLESLNISSCPRVKCIESIRSIRSLNELEHHLHPGVVAEVLAHTAVLRQDPEYISQHSLDWIRETDLFDLENRSEQERLATTLGEAFSLLGSHPIIPEYESFLDCHPEFSAGPWKAWLRGSLTNSGFDVMRQRIERIAPANFTAGMIGGICSVVPEADAGENVKIKWARDVLAMIENHFADRSRDLLPVSAELCLAYSRLADDEGLQRWLIRFTDPSDSASLDPVQDALGRWQLQRGEFNSAIAHAASMSGCEQRDNLLRDIAQSCFEKNAALAGEILVLIESPEVRAKLAHELAKYPAFVQHSDNSHRLIVAAGDSPQDVAAIIGALKDVKHTALIDELSHLLMMDSEKVNAWRVERMSKLLQTML